MSRVLVVNIFLFSHTINSSPVPETVSKKQALQAKLAKATAAVEAKARADAKADQKEVFNRAKKYAKEYRAARNALVRSKRQAKNNGNFYIAPEAKVAFVIRIRGINRVSPQTKKVLQLLRLRQIHNGVFVKLNKASLTMLRLVEPYVTYG